MNSRIMSIEESLNKEFKGKDYDKQVFSESVNKHMRKHHMPKEYGAKALVDPYTTRVIKVTVVKS